MLDGQFIITGHARLGDPLPQIPDTPEGLASLHSPDFNLTSHFASASSYSLQNFIQPYMTRSMRRIS